MKEMICIACPVGCRLKIDDELNITGNKCPKGIVYAKKEMTNPTRIVTSTVKIKEGIKTRIPVRTRTDIPKSMIFQVMNALNGIELIAPVKLGEIVIKNVCNTGVDVITSRSMKRSQ